MSYIWNPNSELKFRFIWIESTMCFSWVHESSFYCIINGRKWCYNNILIAKIILYMYWIIAIYHNNKCGYKYMWVLWLIKTSVFKSNYFSNYYCHLYTEKLIEFNALYWTYQSWWIYYSYYFNVFAAYFLL